MGLPFTTGWRLRRRGSVSPRCRGRVAITAIVAAAALATSPADASTTPPPAVEDLPFPVTIPHRYGETVVESAPTRVAVVGEVEQDTLLALGIVPVTTAEWLGSPPPDGAIHPWALDALGDAEPPVSLSHWEGYDFEAVAAAEPDLIIALFSYIDENDYRLFSEIAPTIAQPAGYENYAAPWQSLAVTVGRAVGQEARAEELVDHAEGVLAEARAAHPEFETATAVIATDAGDGTYLIYAPPDTGGAFLAELGLEPPPAIAELPLSPGGTVRSISNEQVAMLDADVVLWLMNDESEIDAIHANPVYATLGLTDEGREIFVLGDTGVYFDAVFASTVLSLPYAVAGLTPLLAAVIDGDPETTAAA